MRSAVVVAFGFFVLSAGSAAGLDSDFQIPETEMILALQDAVRADDKAWFVAHLHYPVRYYGKTFRMIRSKEWFLSHYATIMGPELKAAILAQDRENYLKNYQGLMVGDGSRNIWLEEFGDPGAGIASDYEIITINNSD
jgi:hypothetical protein